ncbi:hypothetical protein DQ04_02981040 [Trypanosoma grayi]|uniref:hypothetical protein n=1 Tax=Trypanosoma grayi TaxID=71804 RepID=UPI0004F4888E|nr:hypothetical protein DQ04_02981040 [Trypanosoma grayi]KEG11099.1 hypothetical protein DQ04_02981040 [Trypanosoma grayi]
MEFDFPQFVRASDNTAPPASPQKSLWQMVMEAGPNDVLPERVVPRRAAAHRIAGYDSDNSEGSNRGGGRHNDENVSAKDGTAAAALTSRSSWTPTPYMLQHLMSSGFVSQFCVLNGIECTARLPPPPCMRLKDLQLPPFVLARLQRQLLRPRASRRPNLQELREAVFGGAVAAEADGSVNAVSAAVEADGEELVLTALQQLTLTSMLLGHHTVSIGPRATGKKTAGWLATAAATLARGSHNSENEDGPSEDVMNREAGEAQMMQPRAMILVNSFSEVQQCNRWLQAVFTADAFSPVTFRRGEAELVALPVMHEERFGRYAGAGQQAAVAPQQLTAAVTAATPPPPQPPQRAEVDQTRQHRHVSRGRSREASHRHRHHHRSESPTSHKREKRRRHRSDSNHSRKRRHRRSHSRSHHRDERRRSRRSSRRRSHHSSSRKRRRSSSSRTLHRHHHRRRRDEQQARVERHDNSDTQQVPDIPTMSVPSTAVPPPVVYNPVAVHAPHKEIPKFLQQRVPILITTHQSIAEALEKVRGQAEVLPLECVRVVCVSDADRVAQPTSQVAVDASWWISVSNAVDVECQYIVSASRMYDEVEGWLRNTLLRDTPDVVNSYRQRDDTVWCGVQHLAEVVAVEGMEERNAQPMFERVEAVKVDRLIQIVAQHFRSSDASDVADPSFSSSAAPGSAVGSLPPSVGQVAIVVASRREQEAVLPQLLAGLQRRAAQVRATCDMHDFQRGNADVLVTYDWALCTSAASAGVSAHDASRRRVEVIVNYAFPRMLLAPGKEESLLECLTIRTRTLLHGAAAADACTKDVEEEDAAQGEGVSAFFAAASRTARAQPTVWTLLTERQMHGRPGKLLMSRAHALLSQ